MTDYTIEARSLRIVGVGSHDFLVLRKAGTKDQDRVAELHGLAMDRKTGIYLPTGTDEALHSLRGVHRVKDANYKQELPEHLYDRKSQSNETYIAAGQQTHELFTGSEAEAKLRWNAALAAMPELNKLNLNYPSLGFKIFKDTINSNSAYSTYCEIMGFEPYNFPGVAEPGIKGKVLKQPDIDRLKYNAPGKILEKVHWLDIF